MEQLPPVPWDQLATKDDIAALDVRFGTLGAIFTTASLAFAAARF